MGGEDEEEEEVASFPWPTKSRSGLNGWRAVVEADAETGRTGELAGDGEKLDFEEEKNCPSVLLPSPSSLS